MSERKEIPRESGRPDPQFTQKPTGHVIPDCCGYGPSNLDVESFRVPDCGVKAGGEFTTPFVLDERDLPTKNEGKRNRQGF